MASGWCSSIGASASCATKRASSRALASAPHRFPTTSPWSATPRTVSPASRGGARRPPVRSWAVTRTSKESRRATRNGKWRSAARRASPPPFRSTVSWRSCFARWQRSGRTCLSAQWMISGGGARLRNSSGWRSSWACPVCGIGRGGSASRSDREQRDTAAHILVDLHLQRLRRDGVDDVVGDARREALAERTLIPVGPQIEFQGFGFEALLGRSVLDDHAPEIRLAGLWTDCRKFRRRERHGLHIGRRKRLRLEHLAGLGGVFGPRQRPGAGGDSPRG